jgi:hypothetical protein
MRTVLGARLVRQSKEPTSRARLRERASSAVGMIAFSGFVLVGACAAASISLWEVSGELLQRRADTKEGRRSDTKAWKGDDTEEWKGTKEWKGTNEWKGTKDLAESDRPDPARICLDRST